MKKNFVWVLGGRAVAALLQMATLIVLARSISPGEFGFFSAVIGTATLYQAFSDLGVSTLVIRERAEKQHNDIISRALSLNSMLALMLLVASLISLLLIGAFFEPQAFLLLPLALWISAEKNADTWLGVTFADGDVWINSINLVGRRTATLMLFFALMSVSDPLLAYSASAAISATVSAAIAHHIVRNRVSTGDKSIKFLTIIKDSRAFWINTMATQARNLDVMIVILCGGSLQAGLFSVASRVTTPLNMIPTSLASLFLPYAAKAGRMRLKRLIQIGLYSMCGIALLYLAVFMLLPYIIPVALGPVYEGAVLPTQIVVIGLIFSGGASLFGALLQGLGQQKYVGITASAMTVLALAGAAIGSAAIGAIGAALALLLAFLVQFVFNLARLASLGEEGGTA